MICADTHWLAHINPIRYRGYYYDTETELYYLNARYYSLEWRRFISPDAAEYIDPETPNGLNLYAYCNNDPVNFADPSGRLAISTIIIGCLAAFAVGSTVSAISQGFQYGWDEISVGQVLVDGVFAAGSFALVNNLYGKTIQTAVNQGINKAFVGGAIKIIGTTIVAPFISEGCNIVAPIIIDFIIN